MHWLPSVLWYCWLGGRKGIQPVKMGVWWRWALVNPDGVAPIRMVIVSASVNLPLHHKIQKFSSGTGSPGSSRKKGRKTVVVVWLIVATVAHLSYCWAVVVEAAYRPHDANRHIPISHLLSLWRHSHYEVIRASHAFGAHSPRSHYDVIRYWAATLSVRDVRYVRTDTVPCLVYKDGDMNAKIAFSQKTM